VVDVTYISTSPLARLLCPFPLRERPRHGRGAMLGTGSARSYGIGGAVGAILGGVLAPDPRWGRPRHPSAQLTFPR